MATLIDTDKTLRCRHCQHNISRLEDKIVIGALLKGKQHFYTFHAACWQAVRLSQDQK